MKIRNLWKYTFIFAAIGVLFASTASAEIRVGKLRIYPEIGLQETYDSNIYQTEGIRWLPQTKVESDYITSIIPGVKFQYVFGGKHLAEVGYLGTWNIYHRHSKDSYWDHKAWANLSLRFPGGLDIGLEQRYNRSWEQKSATNLEQKGYYDYISGVSVAYRFVNRWKAEARYNRFDHNYDSDRYKHSSYVSDLFGARLYYRFTPRTAVFGEYQHIVKRFDRKDAYDPYWGTYYNDYDSRSNIVFLGLAFDPAGRLKGEIKGGYGWKRWEKNYLVTAYDPSTGIIAFKNRNKPSTWHMYANASYDFSKYTSLGFSASREFLDDSDFANNSYYRTFLSSTFQHFFTRKIGASATVAYENADYQDYAYDWYNWSGYPYQKRRSDDKWTFGLGVFYNIQKYLKTRLDYQYITRDSNFTTYSFNEHKVMFKVVFSP